MPPSFSSSSSSAFPDFVLTSSPEGAITAYNPSSGATLATFSGSRSPRRGLFYTGKGFIAASHISPVTGMGSIHLYNWWSSTALHNLPVPEPVAPLTTSDDGSYLFAGGVSGNIYCISLPSGEILLSFCAHKKSVSCLKISEDGSLLISGGDDGAIVTVPIFQLVDTSADKNPSDFLLQSFSAHDGQVTAIASSLGLSNSIIISCSIDCTCKFWSLLSGSHLQTVAFPCSILGVSLDPTGTAFYSAGSDGFVYKGLVKVGSSDYMVECPDWVALDQKHNGMVVSVAMVNEGKNLVSAAEEGSVYVWDVDTKKVVMVLGNEMGSISDIVVASRICESGVNDVKLGKPMNEFNNLGLFDNKLMSNSVKEAMDLEAVLKVAEKDKSKAIDMLESAIAMYERLLELLLKEAMKGISDSNNI